MRGMKAFHRLLTFSKFFGLTLWGIVEEPTDAASSLCLISSISERIR